MLCLSVYLFALLYVSLFCFVLRGRGNEGGVGLVSKKAFQNSYCFHVVDRNCFTVSASLFVCGLFLAFHCRCCLRYFIGIFGCFMFLHIYSPVSVSLHHHHPPAHLQPVFLYYFPVLGFISLQFFGSFLTFFLSRISLVFFL